MPIPDFIVELRRMIGHHHLWLPGVTAVVESSAVAWVRRDDLFARGASAEMPRRIEAALSDETAARFVG